MNNLDNDTVYPAESFLPPFPVPDVIILADLNLMEKLVADTGLSVEEYVETLTPLEIAS